VVELFKACLQLSW